MLRQVLSTTFIREVLLMLSPRTLNEDLLEKYSECSARYSQLEKYSLWFIQVLSMLIQTPPVLSTRSWEVSESPSGTLNEFYQRSILNAPSGTLNEIY